MPSCPDAGKLILDTITCQIRKGVNTMAIANQTTYNRVTGESITFLRTAQDTDGEYLLFDCRVEPGKVSLPPHVHSSQEERFTLYSGTLGVMLGGTKMQLEPGDGVILPAGIKHQWWNAGDDEVHFRVEAVPAGNLEAVIEVGARLAEEGKLNKKAMPKNPFLMANLGRLAETYLPGIPIWFQKIGLAVGSAVGRVLGYDPELKQYRTLALAEDIRSEELAA
jgi:quercetin dioxygenase-like cupin family protein